MVRKANKPLESEVDPVVPEAEDHSESESDASLLARHQVMSKASAVRAALNDGVDVPKQASLYIKQKYGMDISPQQFSAEKSRIKLRSGGAMPLAYQSASASNGASGTPRFAQGGQTDLLQALEMIKPLIEQLGAEKVKRMVDLLG